MTENKKDKNPLELYFHIPFCIKKCYYCDFLSAPAGEETKKRYQEALLEEVLRKSSAFSGFQVVSIFIGGGTPSLMEPEQIARLLDAVRKHYDLAAQAEITIEVNPGTVTPEGLACYRAAGINRLSIGLQSAKDEELKRIGRIHNYGQFCQVYEAARAVGFANINVDVMSALPEQTLEDYLWTLEQVTGLMPAPEHISAYSLIVEEGTPIYDWKEEGHLQLPSEDCERKMYEETERILNQKGYRRYEISNYAKPGFACRHNCGYWQRVDYAGFGIGAASLINNVRYSNGRDLQEYLLQPGEIVCERQALSVEEQMEETMFLGLRLTQGVLEKGFEKTFGKTLENVYGEVIEKNVKDGLLAYAAEGQDKYLRLTEKGLDLSNYVMAQFLLDGKGT